MDGEEAKNDENRRMEGVEVEVKTKKGDENISEQENRRNLSLFTLCFGNATSACLHFFEMQKKKPF